MVDKVYKILKIIGVIALVVFCVWLYYSMIGINAEQAQLRQENEQLQECINLIGAQMADVALEQAAIYRKIDNSLTELQDKQQNIATILKTSQAKLDKLNNEIYTVGNAVDYVPVSELLDRLRANVKRYDDEDNP